MPWPALHWEINANGNLDVRVTLRFLLVSLYDLAPEGMSWFWHFVEICAHLLMLIRLLCNRNQCTKFYSKRDTVMGGNLFFTVCKNFHFPWRTIKLSAVNWSGISKITHFKIHRVFNRNSGGTGFRGQCLFWITIENSMYFEMFDFRD